MIGYTQLLKDILNLNKDSIEVQLEKLSSHHKLSPLRLKALKKLADIKKGTVSLILKEISENVTGGTYKTVLKFFLGLEADGLLKKKIVGNRKYWSYTEESADLEAYFNKDYRQKLFK